MEFDMRIFIIGGLFLAIIFAFLSQMARTEERIEHPPASWMSVLNLLIIMMFVMAYIFLLIMVLGTAAK